MDDVLLNYVKMLKRIRAALTDDYLYSETIDEVPIRKLFISNLAERTTFKDLSNRFSVYGNIEHCYLRRNQGKSNYAFVTFSNTDNAVRAIKDGIKKEIILHNRCLRVRPANSRHQPICIKQESLDMEKEQDNLEEQYNNPNYLHNDSQNISINILSDDCLRHIFQYLPILDKIRIERVCKRWRLVSQMSWYTINPVNNLLYTDNIQFFYPSEFHILLQKCSQFLKNINA